MLYKINFIKNEASYIYIYIYVKVNMQLHKIQKLHTLFRQ